MTENGGVSGGVSEGSGEGDLVSPADQAGRVDQDNTELVEVVLQVPVGVFRQVQTLAETRGVEPAVLIEQWIGRMIADGDDRLVDLSAVLAAISRVPSATVPVPPVSDGP